MPVLVAELALGDLLERHREVVLRARLHERRWEVVERALAELVVVVVDLASPLRGDDDQRVARVDVVEELIDTRMDHGPAMLPAAARSSRLTMPSSSSTARSRTSFTITWSNSSSSASCSRATASRSSISPPLSVARSRRRRAGSALVG